MLRGCSGRKRPSHLWTSRSFAPAALRMTSSLASEGGRGKRPSHSLILHFFLSRGDAALVILSERAARARAKDLLFFDAATQVVRACGAVLTSCPPLSVVVLTPCPPLPSGEG